MSRKKHEEFRSERRYEGQLKFHGDKESEPLDVTVALKHGKHGYVAQFTFSEANEAVQKPLFQHMREEHHIASMFEGHKVGTPGKDRVISLRLDGLNHLGEDEKRAGAAIERVFQYMETLNGVQEVPLLQTSQEKEEALIKAATEKVEAKLGNDEAYATVPKSLLKDVVSIAAVAGRDAARNDTHTVA